MVFCSSSDADGLWESVDKLLGRGRSAESSVIDAQTFSDFFVSKVDKVRAATSAAPLPALSVGHFPSAFKQASITPVQKKPGLDPVDPGSYRPISNLTVLSKLLERLVARQLTSYLSSAGLLPTLQSGFRPPSFDGNRHPASDV